MASLLLHSAVSALSGHLTVREALSGVCGSVSLATWIFLFVSRDLAVESWNTGID